MLDANGQCGHALDANVPSALGAFLQQHPAVRFIRLQWQDVSGILRAHVVPIQHARAIAAGNKSMRLCPSSCNGLVDNSLLSAASLVGGHTGLPDWTSLRWRASLDPLYASVMCHLVRHTPAEPEPNGDGCPRRALQTVVDKASRLFQMDFLVGFEVEFEVFRLDAEAGLVPHGAGLGTSACSGLRDACFVHVEEAMKVLLDARVGLETVHTEGSRGQYEFVLEPKSPLEAVDELILVHDTLKRVFARHGLMATMFPRPVPSRFQSNGQHTHVSISPPEMEKSFLAGLLRKLPALCALCLPYDLSYERVQPRLAGEVVAWGTEDRRMPIRRIKPGHWEMRCVDATANMYLALAGILSAGLVGCVNNEPLLLPDRGMDMEMGHEDGARLPRSLGEALDQLAEDVLELETMTQSKAMQNFLHLKRCEMSKLDDMGSEEARLFLTELF